MCIYVTRLVPFTNYNHWLMWDDVPPPICAYKYSRKHPDLLFMHTEIMGDSHAVATCVCVCKWFRFNKSSLELERSLTTLCRLHSLTQTACLCHGLGKGNPLDERLPGNPAQWGRGSPMCMHDSGDEYIDHSKRADSHHAQLQPHTCARLQSHGSYPQREET